MRTARALVAESRGSSHESDEGSFTATSTQLAAAQPSVDGRRPLAVTIIGADALHRLVAAGYRVAGVCRCCGAPLVNVQSVARGLGPVCAARTERAA